MSYAEEDRTDLKCTVQIWNKSNNEWTYVKGCGVIVIVPGSGISKNKNAYDTLDREFNDVQYVGCENDAITGCTYEGGKIYPTEAKINDINTIGAPKNSLVGIFNSLCEAFLNGNLQIPAVIIAGSRGGQIPLSLLLRDCWRGPFIAINAGPLTTHATIPSFCRGAFIACMNETKFGFDWGKVPFLQDRFKECAENGSTGLLVQINENHLPKLGRGAIRYLLKDLCNLMVGTNSMDECKTIMDTIVLNYVNQVLPGRTASAHVLAGNPGTVTTVPTDVPSAKARFIMIPMTSTAFLTRANIKPDGTPSNTVTKIVLDALKPNDKRVGIMVAGNIMRPGGACIPPDFGKFKDMPNAKTQEESVFSLLEALIKKKHHTESLVDDKYLGQFKHLYVGNPIGTSEDNMIRRFTDKNQQGKINIKTTEDPKMYKREFGFMVLNEPTKSDQPGIYVSVTAGPNANKTWRTNAHHRRGMTDRNGNMLADTCFRSYSLKAARNYQSFANMIYCSLVSSLTGMANANVKIAICALVGCGIYAGPWKEQINKDIVRLTKLAAIAVMQVTRHTFDSVLIYDPQSKSVSDKHIMAYWKSLPNQYSSQIPGLLLYNPATEKQHAAGGKAPGRGGVVDRPTAGRANPSSSSNPPQPAVGTTLSPAEIASSAPQLTNTELKELAENGLLVKLSPELSIARVCHLGYIRRSLPTIVMYNSDPRMTFTALRSSQTHGDAWNGKFIVDGTYCDMIDKSTDETGYEMVCVASGDDLGWVYKKNIIFD